MNSLTTDHRNLNIKNAMSKSLKTSLIIAISLFSFSFSNAQIITRTTSDYDVIKCAGWMDFILEKGKEGSITIEGEENLLEYIITEVKDDVLYVKTKNNVNLKTSWNETITITIPFNDIDKVTLSGSGDIMSKNKIVANRFETGVSGSGDIVLNVEANTIKAKVTGSGDLTLKGKTNTLVTSVTGSGDFHGFNLKANDVDAKVTGSGDVSVVCNGDLNARVTGSGDIEYKGNPKREDTKVTGSGSISN